MTGLSEGKRGKLLLVGSAAIQHGLDEKRNRVVVAWSVLPFWIVLAVVIAGPLSVGGVRRLLSTLLGFLLPVVWCALVINPLGIEVDAIYERGISSRRASLVETLTGRSFQPIEEIQLVAVVEKGRSNPEGLLPLVGPEKKWRIGPLWKEYPDNFYEKVQVFLREKCPSAKWVYVPFDNALARRRMRWKDARKSSTEV